MTDTNSLDLTKIKMVLTDIDGVMTDGGMYYSARGDVFKKFNVKDGIGLVMLQAMGLKVGIVTTENCDTVKHRAARLRSMNYLWRSPVRIKCSISLSKNMAMNQIRLLLWVMKLMIFVC